ncbi:MAG: single-stranded DNA-binding protein [Crocinitomicaceae bacterium]|jgi:single-strand DNA-binding protein
MLSSLNKVSLIGKVTKKPELQLFETSSVCKITLVTLDYFTDKKTGQKKEINDWHTIVFWGDTAKTANQNILEDQWIYVEGKLKHRKWTAKDGTFHSSAEIFANEFLILPKNNSVVLENLNSQIYPDTPQSSPKPLQEFNASDLDELPF